MIHIIGLLAGSHMDDELDRISNNPLVEPSLTNMTNKAIDILSRNPNGYFLLVEGGHIDTNHHESKAQRALSDFVAFDEAVDAALKKTNEEETLTIVTADHSHV